MAISSISPVNGKTIETFQETTMEEIEAILSKSQQMFTYWKEIPFRDRSDLMNSAADVLDREQDSFAPIMAREMGKPLVDGRAEVKKCAWVCRYFAEHAEKMLSPETIDTDATKSYVMFQPLGVILAVMPWNYPFWQVFRFAAPALMAGNSAVLKHASNVSACSLAIEDVFRKAGFPEGVFRALIIDSDSVEKVIQSSQVRGVTLTGSRTAGKAVAQVAGKYLKKTVLELGGSDPSLVLADADLEPTVKSCVDSRLLNSGQSCISSKRFIVIESTREKFEQMIVEEMKARKMGDPMDETVQIGPQAKRELRDKLHSQVEKSIENGARCLLGGEIPKAPGFFYPPTVLTGVKPGMPAFDEETFGPVAAIVAAKDEEEAILLANSTDFGLGASIYSRNTEKAEKIAAEKIEAGNCFVNDFVKSDPRLPFGGIKESGYGRELSNHGIKEFVNIKTVYLK